MDFAMVVQPWLVVVVESHRLIDSPNRFHSTTKLLFLPTPPPSSSPTANLLGQLRRAPPTQPACNACHTGLPPSHAKLALELMFTSCTAMQFTSLGHKILSILLRLLHSPFAPV
jgi:hypothetical protein